MRPLILVALAACANRAEPSPTPVPAAASALDAPPAQDPTMTTPMTAIDRYRAYLARHGVRADVQVIDDAALAIQAFHFYRVDDRSTEWRAAASPTGLVGGTRAPDDAWWELLGAGDASTIADRIAWLESVPDVDRHLRGHRVIVVRSGDKPAAASIDPLVWRAAPAPSLRTGPDLRALTVWLYVGNTAEPIELTIRAHPSGPAELVARPAHERVASGDPIARATAALDGDDKPAIEWALLTLGKAGAVDAAPAIAKLLARDDAALRGDAAATLGLLEAATTIDAIAAAAGKERDDIALTAEVQALGHMKSAAAARALGALRAKIHDADVRVEVIHALAKLAPTAKPEAKAALADAAAHDADPDLRGLAASYLADL
jgi:hypothetical protein